MIAKNKSKMTGISFRKVTLTDAIKEEIMSKYYITGFGVLGFSFNGFNLDKEFEPRITAHGRFYFDERNEAEIVAKLIGGEVHC